MLIFSYIYTNICNFFLNITFFPSYKFSNIIANISLLFNFDNIYHYYNNKIIFKKLPNEIVYAQNYKEVYHNDHKCNCNCDCEWGWFVDTDIP